MASAFLRSHGVDLDAELERIQDQTHQSKKAPARSPTLEASIEDITEKPLGLISRVSLPDKPTGTSWDVLISPDGRIQEILENDAGRMPERGRNVLSGNGALLAPSLCHPHIHIDKAYLLSHPKYAHLQIQKGDFQEAMSLTGEAKAAFEEDDLLERGQRLIDESVYAGVTHMRAFVEVDAGVGTKCLDAGIALKARAEQESRCVVQICAFAQLPLFTASKDDEEGEVIRGLMQEAASREGADVLGSTPYVESDRSKMERNVEWMIELAIENKKHLDFHLDYNLDPETEPLVWHVVETLKTAKWSERAKKQTIVLGHCTRLTLLKDEDWRRLRSEIGDLPISFVGLPTSDLFMMRTPDRTRGTLDVPRLIKEHGLNACIGINNIGNAFTPHGSCDPLTLACNGVGIYQAGTKQDAELLYECISTRARAAIGLGQKRDDRSEENLSITKGDSADLALFGNEAESWKTRRSVSEAVYLYDHCQGRRACLNGKLTDGHNPSRIILDDGRRMMGTPLPELIK